MGALDAVTSLAATQHGLVSRGQLRSLDITDWQMRVWRSEGVLAIEAPRVYAVSGAPLSHRRDLWAGLLCLGDDALVSHEAAAGLHGFDRTPVDCVEFSMPRTGRGRRTPFVVHTSTFGPTDIVRVDGLRCTSATRTVLDLARARPSESRLAAAIDSAVRSGASAPVVLSRRLDELRGPGRWGVRTLDRLLVDAGGHTMLERRFLQLVRRAGLPRPTTQAVYRDGARMLARVDFVRSRHAVVVEVSGRRGHASDAERAQDAQRRNELQDIGLKVYEYTWDDVHRRPDHVQRTIRRRLDQALTAG